VISSPENYQRKWTFDLDAIGRVLLPTVEVTELLDEDPSGAALRRFIEMVSAGSRTGAWPRGRIAWVSGDRPTGCALHRLGVLQAGAPPDSPAPSTGA